MKQPHQRTEIGAWLVEQRRLLGLKRGKPVRQQDVVAELKGMGYPVGDTYYRAIEGGSKTPGRELRERLGEYFGTRPPEPGGRRADAEVADLVSVVRGQTAAISELAVSVRMLALAQVSGDEDRVRALVEDLMRGVPHDGGPGSLLRDTRP